MSRAVSWEYIREWLVRWAVAIGLSDCAGAGLWDKQRVSN
jgi:hypothetical protein